MQLSASLSAKSVVAADTGQTSKDRLQTEPDAVLADQGRPEPTEGEVQDAVAGSEPCDADGAGETKVLVKPIYAVVEQSFIDTPQGRRIDLVFKPLTMLGGKDPVWPALFANKAKAKEKCRKLNGIKEDGYRVVELEMEL